MQMTPRTQLRGEVVRLAIAAGVIALVIPLLPLYGSGGHLAFVFSLGFGPRGLIEYFLGRWTNVVVVLLGVLFLKRDRLGVAGGVFVAVAFVLAITITQQVIITAPHFTWQTVVFLVLEVVECILLALAAVRAIRVSNL
jgi:hypothetical protein